MDFHFLAQEGGPVKVFQGSTARLLFVSFLTNINVNHASVCDGPHRPYHALLHEARLKE